MIHQSDELHYVGGQWLSTPKGTRTPVINPSDGSTVGYVTDADDETVSAAVHSARSAFPAWSMTPAAERLRYVEILRSGLESRRDAFATSIMRELGAPSSLASGVHVNLAVNSIDAFLDAARTLAYSSDVSRSIVVREPIGVVAAITPWNYPLYQAILKVVPAIIAGCTVVLKPSEETPGSATLLSEAIHETRLPDGVFNMIQGSGESVGTFLVSHPDIDMVSFTGSRRVGGFVASTAGSAIKRVALELGGKSPAVVLDDADIVSAATQIAASCFSNTGQTCGATTRAIVPHAFLAEFEAACAAEANRWLPADPSDDATRMGPLVSQRQLAAVRGYIDGAIDEGARLICGGSSRIPELHPQGAYVLPTVFSDVTPNMTIFHEEVFGPVLAITTYKDVDEAIELANRSEYGLSGGVWSRDPARAAAVAKQLRTGSVKINGARLDVGAPFGGYKQSGIGRECGAAGIDEYLELKTITFPAS